MMKKYSTEYRINNSTYISHVYANDFDEAELLVNHRGLGEVVNSEIADKEEVLASKLFLEKKYKECAHAICYMLSLNNDSETTRRAIMDNGILHETIHLANGTSIDLDSDMLSLYTNIVALENSVSGFLKHE